MSDEYQPPSEFLQALVRDDAPLTLGEFAEANLRRLIAMTRDADPANRDWATFLLAQEDLDTDEVREALLSAADDEHDCVRAEAILGLAQRDKALALPFLQRELSGDSVALPMFEAACLVADPSLIENLSAFAEPSGNEMLDQLVLEAIEACQAGRSL
jgi:hypothetical protein